MSRPPIILGFVRKEIRFMSVKYNVQKSAERYGSVDVTTRGERLSHPQNCKTECPYGRDRAFCFPCYKKIVEEQRTRRTQNGI